MKTLFMASMLLLTACSQRPKSPVAVADSTNNANQSQAAIGDTSKSKADSANAAFLVRASVAGMKETAIAKIETDKGSIPTIKEFAATIKNGTDAVNETIKELASRKNVTLPDSISAQAEKDVDRLFSKLGSQVDEQFTREFISDRKKSIDLYEEAAKNAGDADVRAFADKHLSDLRSGLDSAKSISAKYW